MLERIEARDERFQGLLCFTVAEALMLAEAGHRDLLVAYPSIDRQAISQLAELEATEPDAAPTLMVDEATQLDLIEGAVGRGPTPIRGRDRHRRRLPRAARRVQIGPKRSPIRTPEAAREPRRGDRRRVRASSSTA